MKISTENLNRIMERCTKKEIDFIIYVGQFQDNQGVITGIDYKDVLENIGICKSTFYKILYSLERKEIITINYFYEFSYWEIKIKNNVFACNSDYKKGYMKLNYAILHSAEFLSMTKSEKLIVFHLLKINDYRKAMIKITYKKLMEWTGKSKRSVRKFLATLSNVFKIIKLETTCMFECLIGFAERRCSEVDVKNGHIINFRLKKAKCQSERQDFIDTNIVLKQYKINDTNVIIELLDKVIDTFGTLVPRYFNKIAQLKA